MEPLQDRIDAYLAARERALLRVHSGRESRLDERSLEEHYGDLRGGEGIDTLRAERDAARGRERELYERRLLLAVDIHLDAVGRPLLLRAARALRDGAREDEVGALREEAFLARSQARGALGYETGLALARARLPDVDFEGWVARAQRFLDATDALYHEIRRDVLPRLGVDPARAVQADAAWIDHLGRHFEDLFPSGRALQFLEVTLASLEIHVERTRGLRFDDEPREGRAPSVGRFAIHAPGDVVVSSGVREGPSAYGAIFHAVGRGLAAAYTSADLAPERRRPFDRGLDGAFGWWLSDRLADPSWLADLRSGARGQALALALHFRQLFARRRCAAQAVFAFELAQLPVGADPRRRADHWAEALEQATGLAHRPPLYLEGQEVELGALDQLRGRCLADSLVQHLRERFGRRFWRERGAGALLKELWDTGSAYTVEQLSRELGAALQGPEAWIDSAARGI